MNYRVDLREETCDFFDFRLLTDHCTYLIWDQVNIMSQKLA